MKTQVQRNSIFFDTTSECAFANYQQAVMEIRQCGNNGKVNLAILNLPDYPEIVWYAFEPHKGKFNLLPVFNDCNPLVFDVNMKSASLSILKMGEVFTRGRKVYYCDPKDFAIKRLQNLLHQDFVMLYACCQGLSTNNDYQVVFANTIGEQRKRVAPQWRISNYDRELDLYVPMFQDDLSLFEDENQQDISILDFDYDELGKGDVFRHHQKFWKICETPEFFRQYIVEVPSTLRVSKQ